MTAEERAAAAPERVVGHNQLTLVTRILPDRLARLRSVLANVDYYSRHLRLPGSLVGVATIHTLGWAIADKGRRLLMVSNYDGTWENYIDEFAELIPSGLDAIWSNCENYPKRGAEDVAALKHFLRAHQAPSNVLYSAYPHQTVLRLRDLARAGHIDIV